MRSRSRRITFDEVELKKVRQGPCWSCEKKTRRTVKVSQTVNPFNKGADGIPKTRGQIQAELVLEIEAKLKKPLFCTSCEVPAV